MRDAVLIHLHQFIFEVNRVAIQATGDGAGINRQRGFQGSQLLRIARTDGLLQLRFK